MPKTKRVKKSVRSRKGGEVNDAWNKHINNLLSQGNVYDRVQQKALITPRDKLMDQQFKDRYVEHNAKAKIKADEINRIHHQFMDYYDNLDPPLKEFINQYKANNKMPKTIEELQNFEDIYNNPEAREKLINNTRWYNELGRDLLKDGRRKPDAVKAYELLKDQPYNDDTRGQFNDIFNEEEHRLYPTQWEDFKGGFKKGFNFVTDNITSPFLNVASMVGVPGASGAKTVVDGIRSFVGDGIGKRKRKRQSVHGGKIGGKARSPAEQVAYQLSLPQPSYYPKEVHGAIKRPILSEARYDKDGNMVVDDLGQPKVVKRPIMQIGDPHQVVYNIPKTGGGFW